MNESGLVSKGTLFSIAGFVLGAFLSNHWHLPNLWTLLVSIGGIEAGRSLTNNYYKRCLQTKMNFPVPQYVKYTEEQWKASYQYEALIARVTRWPGLVRNTTLGDALGIAGVYGLSQLLHTPKVSMSKRLWLYGTLGACLADMLLNAYMTWGSSNGVNEYPLRVKVSRGVWTDFDSADYWNPSTCKYSNKTGPFP